MMPQAHSRLPKFCGLNPETFVTASAARASIMELLGLNPSLAKPQQALLMLRAMNLEAAASAQLITSDTLGACRSAGILLCTCNSACLDAAVERGHSECG